MPESITDRCTKAHEYIFLFSKSRRYYFDHVAIKEPVAESSIKRLSQNLDQQHGSTRAVMKHNGPMKAVYSRSSRDSFKRKNSKRALLFQIKHMELIDQKDQKASMTYLLVISAVFGKFLQSHTRVLISQHFQWT